MGFSLKSFFENPTCLLPEPGMTDTQRLFAIAKEFKESEKYARDCGVIDAD
jgi:hypothetical protein